MADLIAVEDLERSIGNDSDFDAVVLVAPKFGEVSLGALSAAIETIANVDDTIDSNVRLIAVPEAAGGRLVLAPTGPLDRDHDDVRRFSDAAGRGIQRAREAGARKPLLVVRGVPKDNDFAFSLPCAGLGALATLWEPLEAREAEGGKAGTIKSIGVAGIKASAASWVTATEAGLLLARDLAGTEPERMAPPRFADHCRSAFNNLPVEVRIIDSSKVIDAEYPLVAAVARASSHIERHRARIVQLEYTGEGNIERTILLAGKDITYDTGGADIKSGGAMAGMSRDKGGGAAVAGFMRAVASLKPRGVRVIAEIAAARNSVGADSFVSDEIITSHAGVRVRIGNTDAEGRLVLADCLSHLRVRALTENAPRLFSIATLTGHAVRAVGPYSIAIDNRAARQANTASSLSEQGDAWGDPFEVSRLRREDWDFVKPRSKADEVLSANNAPSSGTERGHQFPMAFLAIASGLAGHCHRDSESPLAYTHIDIAGSAVAGGDWQHGAPTGAPIIAMLRALLD
jgi:leucyl aminopeptidase